MSRDSKGDCHWARVVALHVHRDIVHVALETAHGQTTVAVPVTTGTAHALGHLHAARACRCGPSTTDPSQVDLLLRILDGVDATRAVIVVRGGDQPAFWLSIAASGPRRELDLNIVDAVSLLSSGRLPVWLVDTAVRDWNAALRDLIDGRTGQRTSRPDTDPPR